MKSPLPWICLALVQAASAPALADTETAPGTGAAPTLLDELRTFTDVFTLVRRNYVDELDGRALLGSAIEGMVATLDPHSELLDPRGLRRNEDTSEGRYGGVGIEVEFRDRRIFVTEVHPDTPAFLEGVRVGDQVLAINGVPVRGRLLMDSFHALHGEPGSTVEIRFRRADLPPRSLVLERQFIAVPSVRGELVGGAFGHLHITHFHAHSADDFKTALRRLEAEAPGGALGGIVIDLRDNPGGVVESATAIADGFLDEGLVVYTRGRYPPTQMEYRASPGQWAAGVPVVVVINERSASSSEILAGALRDHDRATLIGTTTYGKGTVQSLLRLRDGRALKLTTARFFTPSGQSFDTGGIAPDIEVPDAPGNADEGADGVADPPLARALEVLGAAAADEGHG